ncbi:MAG: LamG-like jellyroll fold domain-containing protein [bacterium]
MAINSEKPLKKNRFYIDLNRWIDKLPKLTQKEAKAESLSKYFIIFVIFLILIATGYSGSRYIKRLRAEETCGIPTIINAANSPVIPVADENGLVDCTILNIVIENGGILEIPSVVTNNDSIADDHGIVIKAANFTVEQGGKVDLKGKGYSAGEQLLHLGSGKSSEISCAEESCGGSGGGHGGAGGRGDPGVSKDAGDPGQAYGDELSPLTLGSGGGTASNGVAGGAGGSALKLELTGNLILNGELDGDGADGSILNSTGAGGGAGGSIWITAKGFSGNGLVHADGGSGGQSTLKGGGGGGGRIAMTCTETNSFSGIVTVAPGLGGVNNGQVGSKIGPSCFPAIPTNLAQFEVASLNPKTITQLQTGQGSRFTQMEFVFKVADVENPSTLVPELEIRQIGQEFTGIPTHTGTSVAYTGTAAEARVIVSALLQTKEYHWRVRVRDGSGLRSEWASFGANAENEIDFIILGNPNKFICISGGCTSDTYQTGEVKQALSQPFIVEIQDSVGHKMPATVLNWQVSSGNGVLTTTTGTTGSDFSNQTTYGRAQTILTLGETSGTENNVVQALRGDLINNPMLFKASATSAAIDHYVVEAPSVALVNTDFSPEVVITAKDLYENTVTSANNNISLLAVLAQTGCPTTCSNGNGTLTPSTATLQSGIITLSNIQYSTAEAIKLKVTDGSKTGYSGIINVVNEYGNCFGLPNVDSIIHLTVAASPWIFQASSANGGVINCSNVSIIVDSSATVELRSESSLGLGVNWLVRNLDIEASARVSSDDKGYLPGIGPGGYGGTYWDNKGATHGGWGYGSPKQPYGDVFEPITLGSGANTAGAGAIKIVVQAVSGTGGTLNINGEISASVAAASANGISTGAGGSILVDTETLSGAGLIKANSGNTYRGNGLYTADGAPGSGGRIAIYYETDSSSILSTVGIDSGTPKVQAFGGSLTTARGSAGTIYLEHLGVDTSHQGRLTVDNVGDIANTQWAGIISGTYHFSEINLLNYGNLGVMGVGSNLIVDSTEVFQGDSSSYLNIFGKISLPDTITIQKMLVNIYGAIYSVVDGYNTSNMNITIDSTGDLRLAANAWGSIAGNYALDSLIVKAGAIVYLDSYVNSNTCNPVNLSGCEDDYGITLRVNDLTVENTALITADGTGYGSNSGKGTGTNANWDGYGSGAAYGGYGSGTTGAYGLPNGDVFLPKLLGSGGGGEAGRGGGSIYLKVNNSLINSGVISSGANSSWHGGGGSGGSILIWTNVLADSISHTGIISTNGYNNGGGGGRIGIYYQSTENFLINVDHIQSRGAGGGPGTVYVEQITNEQTTLNDIHKDGSLFSDNNGNNALSAGLITDSYHFNEIHLTRYGHLTVMGSGSTLTVSDDNSIYGDNTFPDLTTEGTFIGPDSGVLVLDGIDLGLKGAYYLGSDNSASDVTIGDVYKGGLTLYANNWSNAGHYYFGDLDVTSKAKVTTISYDDPTNDAWQVSINDKIVKIEANNITSAAASIITADGSGYIIGPGGVSDCNNTGRGASYSGWGSYAQVVYGNVYEPRSLGSDCSNGTHGAGGAMEIIANQTFVWDGAITSNGIGYVSTGGSIYIRANALSGSGVGNIQLNGVGWSSGGRGAIYYVTNTGFVFNNSTLHSTGYSPGTIYVEQLPSFYSPIQKRGTLYVDNANSNGSAARLQVDSYQFGKVVLTRYGHLIVMGQSGSLTITDSTGMTGDATISNLTVEGSFFGPSSLTIEGVTLVIPGAFNFGSDNTQSSLTIGGNLNGGLTLMANNWSNQGNYDLGDVFVTAKGLMTLVGYDDGDTNYPDNSGQGDDDRGVYLNLQNLNVAANGVISSVAQGYYEKGPGRLSSYGGWTASNVNPYGSVYLPIHLGSSGSHSNKGGGAIKIDIANELNLNGTIDVSAGNTGGCGVWAGSGGSLLIKTNQLSGAGTMQSNGGTGSGNWNFGCWAGYSGSGGRVAVYYVNDSSDLISTLGTTGPKITAYGGTGDGNNGTYPGGAGTVYIEKLNSFDTAVQKNGLLFIDNRNTAGPAAGLPTDTYTFEQISLMRNGHLTVMGSGSVVNVTSSAGVIGDDTLSNLAIEGTLSAPSIFEINGYTLVSKGRLNFGSDNSQSTLTIGGEKNGGLKLYANTWNYNNSTPYIFGDVTISPKGLLTEVSYDSGDTNWDNDYGLYLDVSNLNLQTGGKINLDASGYTAERGKGNAWGASYGGYGAGGAPYGSYLQPIDLGSGAKDCATGGGALKLTVSNTLTVDGDITANGSGCGWGGGSGGSVYLDTDILIGSGLITANGASGNRYWAGSGGRVAIYYKTDQSNILNQIKVTYPKVQAYGSSASGDFYNHGAGPGTIYVEQKETDVAGQGSMFIFNNSYGYLGNYIISYGPDLEAKDYNFRELYIDKGAKIRIKGDTTIFPRNFVGEKYKQPEVSADMLALWHMDETENGTCSDDAKDACDSTGLGHNATSVGTTIIDGRFGKARSSTAGSNYLSFNSVTLPSSYTIAFWKEFPLPVTSQGWRSIIRSNENTHAHIVVDSSGYLGIFNNAFYSTGYNVNSLTGWHHITAVASGTTTKFYVNFQLVGTANTIETGAISGIGNNPILGLQNSGGIDEVAIFNKELSQLEIIQAYGSNDYVASIINDNSTKNRGSVINVSDSFFLGQTSFLDGNAQGFSSQNGSGKGLDGTGSSGGGGGAHGGAGGVGGPDGIIQTNPTAGGLVYDSAVKPVGLGSGGGLGATGALGGTGGGAFSVISDGTVNINGKIQMNATNGAAASPGAGGGAGGSIYLEGSEVNISSTGILEAKGGNGGSDGTNQVGGGGGGGIIVFGYRSTINNLGTVSKNEGTGYQAGGTGVFGQFGVPTIQSENQHKKNDDTISVGQVINEKAVKFKFNVSDPDASDTLTPQVEIVIAGDNSVFNVTNLQTGQTVAWSGGGTPVNLEVLVENTVTAEDTNSKSKSNVLGISSDQLVFGGQYKWRGRVIDGSGVASGWIDFGSNGDATDFAMATVSCGDNNASGMEQCDGTDLKGASCNSLGYDTGTLSCTNSCTYTGCSNYQCGNGILEPGNSEQCDGLDLGILTCNNFDNFDGGFLSCNNSCQVETTNCSKSPVCGNNLLESGEQCDGNVIVGGFCNDACQIELYPTVTVTPTPVNTQAPGETPIVTINPEVTGTISPVVSSITPTQGLILTPVPTQPLSCGNGIIDSGEQCDGIEMDQYTCQSLGFDTGTLTCNEQCNLDTTLCSSGPKCGNGIIEPGEQCDGSNDGKSCKDFTGFESGKLSCNNQCKFEVDQCLTTLPETGKAAVILANVVKVIMLLPEAGFIFTNLYAIPWLKDRKKSKSWGIVYDKLTQKPILFASVKLYLGEKMLREKVTDLDGKFGFLIDYGKYTIIIDHPGYNTYQHTFNYSDKEGSVGENVALIRRATESSNDLVVKKTWKEKLQYKLHQLNQIILIAGLLFSISITALNPITFNFVVVAFYAVELIIYYFLTRKKQEWGVVQTSKGQRIQGAFVRLFSIEEERQLDVIMTDEQGRFRFDAKNAEYLISVAADGYKFPAVRQHKKDLITERSGAQYLKVKVSNGKMAQMTIYLDTLHATVARDVKKKAFYEQQEAKLNQTKPHDAKKIAFYQKGHLKIVPIHDVKKPAFYQKVLAKMVKIRDISKKAFYQKTKTDK